VSSVPGTPPDPPWNLTAQIAVYRTGTTVSLRRWLCGPYARGRTALLMQDRGLPHPENVVAALDVLIGRLEQYRDTFRA